jgi:hypothetical protein
VTKAIPNAEWFRMSSTCRVEADENVAHAEVMVRYRLECSSKVIRTAHIKPE